MLTVACYLWSDEHWRHGAAVYGPQHVRQLRDMVAKNLTAPYEFACITDRPELFRGDEGIRAIKLDTTTHIPNTEFVKLMTFHPCGGQLIGERVLQLDLDTVIVGNIDSIVDRDEDIVVWRNPSRVPWEVPSIPSRALYNGSVILYRCGTLPDIWTEFVSAKGECQNRYIPRDTQVWMSAYLGPDAPYWDGSHGIYRLAREDTPGSGIWGELPANARIVTFVGSEHKPTKPAVRQANPWIDAVLAQYGAMDLWPVE